MLLHTPLYLIFLAVVVAIYRLLPTQRWPRTRPAFLLAASYFFYAAFDLRFAALLLGLTVAVYWLANAIPGSPRARLYTTLGVMLSLGVLGIFKYNEFFLENLNGVLRIAKASGLPSGLRLILPVGISFYTFQAISYIMEVYRGTIQPAPSWTDFALYMAFFPKLVAGPIISPSKFLSQINPLQADGQPSAWWPALRLITLGFFKKVVIADSVANLAQMAFRAAGLPPGEGSFPTPLYWQGFYLYAFQIYADFSGYTDIARGSAVLLGFALPENFERPYFSSTIAEFWNRWHISLTLWFREYLFFPLSRTLIAWTNRRYLSAAQVITNLVTMTLIGLWHGAGWTFIAWGVWHGVWLSIERVSRYRPTRRWQKIIGGVAAFHLVGLGWVLFGADSFTTAWRFLNGLVAMEQMHWLSLYLPAILLAGGMTLGLDLITPTWLSIAHRSRWRWRPVLLAASWAVIASLLLLRWANGGNALPFIYGQF
jgi:D-alanyl-lipoteichoic acid acyltransferase DltB (MBOAT superfamily)